MHNEEKKSRQKRGSLYSLNLVLLQQKNAAQKDFDCCFNGKKAAKDSLPKWES